MIRSDVTFRSFNCAAVPFSIPTEPVSVRFRPPLDQNRRRKNFCVARPRAKIDIELTGDNFLERKLFLAMTLIDIRSQHQAHIWNFPEIADPTAHRGRK